MAYSRTRARDADRAAATEVVVAAYADGQLTRAELDARTARLQTARTFAELDEQLADLQKPGEQSWRAPHAPGRSPRRTDGPSLVKGAAAAAVAAIALAIVLPQVFSDDQPEVPYAGVAENAADGPDEPAAIKDPRTAQGFATFLDAMEAKLKTTKATRAQLSEDSITVTIPVSPDKSRRYVTWSWDGTWTEYSTGKYSDSEDVWLLDLRDLDATTFGAALELALGRVEDAESASFSIESNGKSCYSIYVDNRFDESFLGRFACNGKLVEQF